MSNDAKTAQDARNLAADPTDTEACIATLSALCARLATAMDVSVADLAATHRAKTVMVLGAHQTNQGRRT